MDHIYMRAWDSVIYPDDMLREQHLREAREKNAPEDAVFFSAEKQRWVVFSEVTNTSMIKWVTKALQDPKKLLLQSER